MQALLDRLKKWIVTPQGFALASSALSLLVVSKLYFFNGSVCRASRDLTGKVIVVTGGNTGIGKATIEQLSRQNCTIIFGARDQQKSQQALEDIRSRHKQARLIYFPLDLASKRSIRQFSLRVKEQCDRIDVLINNAAVMAIPSREVTEDGFEMQMGVNHLGHFYLTSLLWDWIRKAEKPRVVNVSSRAHRGFMMKRNMHNTIDFQDTGSVRDYTGTLAYTRSKAANILFTRELQRRMDAAGFEGYSYSVHPGVVRTELTRYLAFSMSLLMVPFTPALWFFMKSPRQGAQTTLYAVLEDEGRLRKGGYFSDCGETESSPFTNVVENGEKLWRASEGLLGIEFNV